MIYLLSLLTVLSSVTTLLLFKRLKELESPRNNPLKGYDMDHLSILLELSPLLTDVETENALRELISFLRLNDGILSKALDTYINDAIDSSDIRYELSEALEEIEDIRQASESSLEESDISHLMDESEVIELIDSAISSLTIKIER